MEEQRIALARRITSCQRDLPQPVHRRRDVNLVGTARRAGVASHAQPDVAAFENGFALIERHHSQKQVGTILHRIHHGTARCAFVAVIAQPQLLPRQAINFLNKIAHVASFSEDINKSRFIREPRY